MSDTDFYISEIAVLSLTSSLAEGGRAVTGKDVIEAFLWAVRTYEPNAEMGFALKDAFWKAADYFNE